MKTTPTGKHHSYDKSTWLWWNWFQCHVGKSPFKINELPLYGTTEIWSVVLYFILSYKLCVMTKTRLEWCSTQRTCTYILHKYTLYLRENDGVSHACQHLYCYPHIKWHFIYTSSQAFSTCTCISINVT